MRQQVSPQLLNGKQGIILPRAIRYENDNNIESSSSKLNPEYIVSVSAFCPHKV